MKNWTILLALIFSMASGAVLAQDMSPKEVYEAYVNSDDFYVAKKFVSQDKLKEFEQLESQQGQNISNVYIMLKKIGLPNRDAMNIEDVKIDGDKAILFVKSTAFVGTQQEHEFIGKVYFHKEDGKWKIIKDDWTP